jgi:hypothetical protein
VAFWGVGGDNVRRQEITQEAIMPHTPLTPEQQAEAQRIYDALKAGLDSDIRQIAELLASKPDAQLLGATAFEVRQRVHKIGAKAIQSARAERKKGAT